MLGGDDDGVDAHGLVLLVVFDGHLALGIGAQVGHHAALAPYVGQHAQQSVGQVQGQRHVVLRLVGGVAKHHALVAGALVLAVLTVDAAVDVVALFVDGGEHAAGVALEHVLTLGVSDAVDDLAGNALQVDVGLGLHFAGQHHLSGGDERFAGHLRLGVEGQQFVQHGIRNLVGHFVGVPFGHRFRCKKIIHNAQFIILGQAKRQSRLHNSQYAVRIGLEGKHVGNAGGRRAPVLAFFIVVASSPNLSTFVFGGQRYE